MLRRDPKKQDPNRIDQSDYWHYRNRNPKYSSGYLPYAERKCFTLSRQKRELLRAAVDVETLDKVHAGLIQQYRHREEKVNAQLHKWRKEPSKSASANARLQEFAHCRKALDKLHRRIRRQLCGIIESRNRIYKDCTPEQRAERTAALLRVPPAAFAHFDRLSADEQDAELLRLVELHGQGSGNAGYADALLNLPGLVNPHTTGSRQEKDKSMRRSLLQWEMIDRLIYAATHPDKYQHIFFHETKNVVERWGKNRRQMRSEGRLTMVRVLIVLILRMDVKKTLRTGKYNPETEKFEGISRADIAKEVGVSVHAVKHALENLVALKILHPGKQPRDSYPGSQDEPIKYKGLAVVRKFTMLLIAGLSLEHLHRGSLIGNEPDNGLSQQQMDELREIELSGEELGIDVSGDLAIARAQMEINAALADVMPF